MRKAPLSLAIALIIAFSLRATAVQAFRANGDQLPAGIEDGTFMMLNKLARTFEPNDVVVCKIEGQHQVWEIKETGLANGNIAIRKADLERTVSKKEIIGRVFLQSR